MDIKEAINFLDEQIKDPKKGLPKEIFHFISKLTPLPNVELIINDEKGRILLSWRDDIHGRGWHVPGGIIRFKEKIEHRIEKVAEIEIGTNVRFDPEPLAIKELICEHDIRGHFIAFIYKCYLPENFVINNKGKKENEPGFLRWHDSCPKNLIKCQEDYKEFM